jgi:regulatory helix-turn-helix LysR family protein
MQRAFDDLLAFLAVARERSFTKAAAKLGTTRSVGQPKWAIAPFAP